MFIKTVMARQRTNQRNFDFHDIPRAPPWAWLPGSHLSPTVLLFLFIFVAGNALDDRVSINCGSSSPSIEGSKWMPDVYPLFSSSPVTVSGISSRTSVSKLPIVDPVPYGTARISSSQFSYNFVLNPGQKYIRLHFNPTLYKFNSGFFQKRLDDFFSVEAGPFTLLSNFIASITARALGLNVVIKDFCVDIPETLDFSLVFTPAIATNPSHCFYAFINGIEIISAPSSLSYCPNGDAGVQILGQKSVVHIDSSTAHEMVYRINLKRDFVPFDDNVGAFRMGAAVFQERANEVRHSSWKVSVDVGFRYLIRLHFSERGLKMAENEGRDFMILINGTIAIPNADAFHERERKGFLWHKNFMVMVNGNKREGKRSIIMSLETECEFMDGFGPLEGFEIFKLSNHDNSLASPNPFDSTIYSLSSTTQNLLSSLGPTNLIAGVVIMLTCLVSIIVHKLQQSLESKLPEDENAPSTRAASLCRCFSLAEIRLATSNFYGALVIGKGGFGKVYKGRVDNGKLNVAIKRLRASSKQGKRQFQAEIELLSELRHVNLVSLVGYCSERGEMILVYEYVPNGSLAYHLYKLSRESTTTSLSWKQRLEICIGAGRGLDYLHTGHRIAHRDIKASNILLDEKFVPKVSDFGLAKIHTGRTQASTNFKGTFGHIDPDYFRTHRLTLKSDIYSFGVMMLEVLCGRPAVEPWAEEDKRSLTTWARDKISKGEVDDIIAPNLRGDISPASLNAFLSIVERCLHDEPKKRPAIAHVIINLEFALEQQENANSSLSNEIAAVADALSFIQTVQPKNVNSLLPNEIEQVPDLPQPENTESYLPNEAEEASEATRFTVIFSKISQAKTQPLPTTQRSVEGTRKQIMTSNTKNVTSSFKYVEKTTVTTSSKTEGVESPLKTVVKTTLTTSSNTKTFTSPFKNVLKKTIRKISRILPRGAIWKGGKSVKKEAIGSISAPIARRAASMKPRDSTFSESRNGEELLLAAPNLRVFPFQKLRAITRNFHVDTVIGEGGYGRVFKAFLQEDGVKTCVAIKKLLPDSMQGIEEWLSEVKFLGRLSHPNLVKLVGYCLENNQQLLVYEFMEKGSLERSLFRRYATPLPWNTRINILIGAARGLAYLHASEIIYRDLKSSNILLDELYQAKLSDFGLAKSGPDTERSHVTTRVMGTYGYAAPEYITTGHLYVKSDMYSFGVVLLEMLTGLRALDNNRPSGQQNLVHWIRPLLSNKRKLSSIMDPRLEEIYPAKSAFQIAQLARICLEVDHKKRPSSQEAVEALEKMQ